MSHEPSKSWVDVSSDSDFSIRNIPFGVFENGSGHRHICSAIGDYVSDL